MGDGGGDGGVGEMGEISDIIASRQLYTVYCKKSVKREQHHF